MRPPVIVFCVFITALFYQAPAKAVLPDEMLADPQMEARARDISRELRCLVCQNQSIDDSDAQLARDLRVLVRERLMMGDSNADVLGFVTRRYGDFVLLKPPVKSTTYLLWGVPVALMGLGLGILIAMMRRRPAKTSPDALSTEEQARLKQLMDRESDTD